MVSLEIDNDILTVPGMRGWFRTAKPKFTARPNVTWLVDNLLKLELQRKGCVLDSNSTIVACLSNGGCKTSHRVIQSLNDTLPSAKLFIAKGASYLHNIRCHVKGLLSVVSFMNQSPPFTVGDIFDEKSSVGRKHTKHKFLAGCGKNVKKVILVERK